MESILGSGFISGVILVTPPVLHSLSNVTRNHRLSTALANFSRVDLISFLFVHFLGNQFYFNLYIYFGPKKVSENEACVLSTESF